MNYRILVLKKKRLKRLGSAWLSPSPSHLGRKTGGWALSLNWVGIFSSGAEQRAEGFLTSLATHREDPHSNLLQLGGTTFFFLFPCLFPGHTKSPLTALWNCCSTCLMKPSALAGRLTNCKRVWLLHVQRPDLDFGLDDHLIESSTVQTLGRYYWILCIRENRRILKCATEELQLDRIPN